MNIEFVAKKLSLYCTIIFMIGCSSVDVQNRADSDFNNQSTITVVSKDADPLSIKGEIEHQLLAMGYNIISQDVALQKVKSKTHIKEEGNTLKANSEVYQATELKSVYMLNFSYTHAFDGAFRERKIKKLFGTLVDLESGKIIKSFKIDRSMWAFSGNSAFIEELADQLE